MSWYKNYKTARNYEETSFRAMGLDIGVRVSGEYYKGSHDQPPEYPEGEIIEVTMVDPDEFIGDYLEPRWEEFGKDVFKDAILYKEHFGTVPEFLFVIFNGVKFKVTNIDLSDLSKIEVVDADIVDENKLIGTLPSRINDIVQEIASEH